MKGMLYMICQTFRLNGKLYIIQIYIKVSVVVLISIKDEN